LLYESLENLDNAVLRRFAFKVAFQPLTEEGRLILFERYFPSVLLTEKCRARLDTISMLTPGDFKAVLSRVRFTAGMSAESLVAELEAECSYKKPVPSIGFRN